MKLRNKKIVKNQEQAKPPRRKRQRIYSDSEDEDFSSKPVVVISDSEEDEVVISDPDSPIFPFEETELEDDEDYTPSECFAQSPSEYFELDRRPLIQAIIKRIQTKTPGLNIPNDLLQEAVRKAITKVNEDIVQEYCSAKPKDTSWKNEVEDDVVEKLEPVITHIREELEKERPTLVKILDAPIADREKKLAIRLFDILNNAEPYTEQYFNLEERIKTLLKTTQSQNNQLLKELREEIENERVTLSKILNAPISRVEKKCALRLFDSMCSSMLEEGGLLEFSDAYLSHERAIMNIINVDTSLSPEQLKQMDELEARLSSSRIDTLSDLKTKILTLETDEETRSRIYQMYSELCTRTVKDAEYFSLRNKLLWAVSLPHHRYADTGISPGASRAEISRFCSTIATRLNQKLYGMNEVKERLIEIVNNRITNPKSRSSVALKGPPGVGKTRVASVLAEAMNLPFERISVGGMVDPSIFKGTDNSWLGSAPSIIIQILRKMKVCNGIVLLDEIDKLGTEESSKAKEVQYALLHMTDYVQNAEFQDLFLTEFPHDISKVWFMFAMNSDEGLDPALRDRLDILEVKGYSKSELVQITTRFVVPETAENIGLNRDDITITEQACSVLFNLLSKEMSESGIRPVEKAVHRLISKINLFHTFFIGNTEEDMDSDKNTLSFTVPDYSGLPYRITRKTIEALLSEKRGNVSHLAMYM